MTPIWTSAWAYKQKVNKLNIVNISSGATRSAYEGWGEYCSTKAALKMASQIFGLEEKDDANKTMLLLEPGVINTPMQNQVRQSDKSEFPMLDKFINLHKDGNLVEAEDVSIAICEWLSSDKNVPFIETRFNKGEKITIA